MLKTHCDLCDAVGATKAMVKLAPVPGKPGWDRTRLKVTVIVNDPRHSGDDEEGHDTGRKELCDGCRLKLVADTFGLRTAPDYNALHDQLVAALRNHGERVEPDPPGEVL